MDVQSWTLSVSKVSADGSVSKVSADGSVSF